MKTSKKESLQLIENIENFLTPIAHWSEIIDYLEENNPNLLEKKETSPSLYAKYRGKLLDSEIFVVANLIVYRQLNEGKPLTQGQLARLAAGDPNKEGLSETAKAIRQKRNVKWNNNIRNNIKPIMGDYFEILSITTNGGDEPGKKGYSISANTILINFFMEKVYID